MRKIILFILYIAITLILNSCTGNSTELKLNTADGLTKIKTLLLEKYGEDKEIYSISMMASSLNQSEFEYSIISYKENNEEFTQVYYASNNTLFDANKVELDTESKGFIKLKDLDLTNIPSLISDASKQVSAVTDEFHNFQVYFISADIEKDNSISSKLDLLGEKKTTGTSFYGKRVRDSNFFKFEFEGTKDGKIKIADDSLEK